MCRTVLVYRTKRVARTFELCVGSLEVKSKNGGADHPTVAALKKSQRDCCIGLISARVRESKNLQIF